MNKLILLLFCTSVISCTQPKGSQGSGESADTRQLLNKQEYSFIARTVLPTGGRIVQLTSAYDMKVGKDTVVAYLPYFGRAYSAPIGSSNPGIQFTSTDFSYKREERKKGGWTISIRPKDVQDIQQVNLTVSESGSASLQVTSNNRQPISYNGYIDKK